MPFESEDRACDEEVSAPVAHSEPTLGVGEQLLRAEPLPELQVRSERKLFTAGQ